jgi:glycosyltransferase involved in cell wall biosynthesis
VIEEMDKIAILIPCYNEESTIEKVIKDFKRELPEAKIYVYDNNSTDRTVELASNIEGVIIRFEERQGKGNVVRTMFREIDAKCYIMVDGDDTYPAEFAKEMVGYVIESKADMVVGDRLSSTYFIENKRLFHNFGNKLVKSLTNIIYRGKITDIMTGYRAFSYMFVKTFPILSKGFEIETEMTIHALDKNLLVKNVIIEYKDRPAGSISKLNTYSDGFKVIKKIITFYKSYKPFSFFGFLSLFLGVIGLVFLTPVLIEYINTGLVSKMPTFIASIFFFLCAIQSFFGGLLLDNLEKQSKQEFEIKYNEYNDKMKELLKRGNN